MNQLDNLTTQLNQKSEWRSNLKTFLLLIGILMVAAFITQASSAEPTEKSESGAEEKSEFVPSPKWPINLQQLAKHSADKFHWLKLGEHKALLTQFFAQSKKQRGNIFIIPTPGENTGHPRLVGPMTQQLVRLGWQVFVATLPLADFPVSPEKLSTDQPSSNNSDDQNNPNQTKPSTKTSTNSGVDNSTNKSSNQTSATPIIPAFNAPFFNQQSEYQQFVDQIINQAITQIKQNTTSQTKDLVIISNKQSAYWTLPSASLVSEISHLIFIDPQLTGLEFADLDDLLKAQTRPIYLFNSNNRYSRTFYNAIQQNQWPTKKVRVKQLINSKQRIQQEDPQIAKAITGWVESLKKKKK